MSDEPTTPSPDPSLGNPDAPPKEDEKSWLETHGIPKEHHEPLSKIKDVKNLAQSYVNLERMLGSRAKGLTPLTSKSSQAEIDEFWKQMGKPGEPGQYDVPKELADKFDDSAPIENLRKLAHKHNLTQTQAQGLMKDILEGAHSDQLKSAQEEEEIKKDNISTIMTRWGSAFDERLAIAKKAVAELGSDDLKQLFDESGLGNDPAMLEMLYRAGKLISEASGVSGKPAQESIMTPEEATREMNKLKSDKEFMTAYKDNRHHGHKEATDRMTMLLRAQRGVAIQDNRTK